MIDTCMSLKEGDSKRSGVSFSVANMMLMSVVLSLKGPGMD